jgi:hypothetical protein
MEMVKVLIGADVCPIRRNLSYFKNGDAKSIFNDLLEEFESADLSIVNLECPFINVSTPIKKCGPVLGVESDCMFSYLENDRFNDFAYGTQRNVFNFIDSQQNVRPRGIYY